MKRFGAAVALAALAGVPVTAHAQAPADVWTASVTPYLWTPSIEGSFRYGFTPGGGRPGADVESSASDYLKDLRFAFMIAGEARKGRLSLFSDFIYLDFKAEDSSIRTIDFGSGRIPVAADLNANTRSSLKGLTWSGLVGYSLEHSRAATHDVFAGVRLLSLKAETGWQLAGAIQGPGAGQSFERSGSVSDKEKLWDGVVGMRGRFTLGDGRWSVPYYADVGAGGSDLTWQAMIGIAYRFGWGDLGLMYRHLSYEQDGDKLINNLTFSGPAFGATFRF